MAHLINPNKFEDPAFESMVQASVVDALRLKLRLMAEPLLNDLADRIAASIEKRVFTQYNHMRDVFEIKVIIKDNNGKETI